ncbi:MAG: HPr family phosphocarrier protein [Oscillospiraceae bacterium]
MKTFTYTIKDEVGIHARPAGLLAKKAKEFKSEMTIDKNGKAVNLTKLMAVMGMGIKCGDTVEITVNGEDENIACEEIKKFFEENL